MKVKGPSRAAYLILFSCFAIILPFTSCNLSYSTLNPHVPFKTPLRLLLLPLSLLLLGQRRSEHGDSDEACDEAHKGREEDGGARDGVVPRGEEAVEGGAVLGVDEGLFKCMCLCLGMGRDVCGVDE